MKYNEVIFRLPIDDAWGNIPYSLSRIKRKLISEFSDYDYTRIDDISSSIWLSKLECIKEVIHENF